MLNINDQQRKLIEEEPSIKNAKVIRILKNNIYNLLDEGFLKSDILEFILKEFPNLNIKYNSFATTLSRYMKKDNKSLK